MFEFLINMDLLVGMGLGWSGKVWPKPIPTRAQYTRIFHHANHTWARPCKEVVRAGMGCIPG